MKNIFLIILPLLRNKRLTPLNLMLIKDDTCLLLRNILTLDWTPELYYLLYIQTRFHFTEGMKGGAGQEGEAMVVQMIGSLAEALECQYGRVATRLARAFRPRPVSSTSGWKWVFITYLKCYSDVEMEFFLKNMLKFSVAELNPRL